MRLEVRRLDPDVPLPAYQREHDAGLDLCSAQDVVIQPGDRVVVGTGLAVAVPVGHVGLVTPRSGLAERVGLSIVNSPGVIDAGYRGEVKLILVNLDRQEAIEVARGTRVAQLLVCPVVTADVAVVDELSATERGEGGHGSTGV